MSQACRGAAFKPTIVSCEEVGSAQVQHALTIIDDSHCLLQDDHKGHGVDETTQQRARKHVVEEAQAEEAQGE